MDLIYANYDLEEQGILRDYTLDLAFGYSENNFELTVPSKEEGLKENQLIYYPNTEYGGIVDSIYEDTYRRVYRYSGRTWQGILDSKIITPIGDYRVLNGASEVVLSNLFNELGLDTLFAADTEMSFTFNGIQVPRYIPVYSGLQVLLLSLNAKLVMRYDNTQKKVLVGITTLSDYTTIREWSSAEINYKSKKYYNCTNHLICLGSGELKNRHVIHLFTDELGGIKPYTYTTVGLQDADYILEEWNKELTGIDEVVDVFDYPNAETRENYIVLDNAPKDWAESYVNYYERNSDGSYIQYEREYSPVYEPLNSIPPDWNQYYACQKYYEKDGSTYKNVELVQHSEGFFPLSSQPQDWNTNYSVYYEFYSDGVVSEYRHVEGDSYPVYTLQTRKPTDWNDNKDSYYVHVDDFAYTYEIKTKTGNKWKTETKTYNHTISTEGSKNKKISLKSTKKTGSSYHSVSDYAKNIIHTSITKIRWEANKFYTKSTEKKAPNYNSKVYFIESVSTSAPTFEVGKYYKLNENVEIIPQFKRGHVFELVFDNYGDLVEKGIERLKESWTQNTLETDLVEDVGDFDINDLVGNSFVKSNISKKILRFDKGLVNISYITGKGGK